MPLSVHCQGAQSGRLGLARPSGQGEDTGNRCMEREKPTHKGLSLLMPPPSPPNFDQDFRPKCAAMPWSTRMSPWRSPRQLHSPRRAVDGDVCPLQKAQESLSPHPLLPILMTIWPLLPRASTLLFTPRPSLCQLQGTGGLLCAKLQDPNPRDQLGRERDQAETSQCKSRSLRCIMPKHHQGRIGPTHSTLAPIPGSPSPETQPGKKPLTTPLHAGSLAAPGTRLLQGAGSHEQLHGPIVPGAAEDAAGGVRGWGGAASN